MFARTCRLTTRWIDTHVTLRPVKSKRFGIVVAALIFDAALLLIVGAVTWGSPSPADAAVGKGLMTLGVALGIPALLLLALFDSPVHDATGGEAMHTERDTA